MINSNNIHNCILYKQKIYTLKKIRNKRKLVYTTFDENLHNGLKNIQLKEEFKDTEWVVRICKLKKDNTMDKRSNNDLQNTTQKTKDEAT